MEKIIFCSYSDPPRGSWEFINDTPEDRINAIKNGAKHFTAYSFSDDPRQNPNTIRYGDLTIDFDRVRTILFLLSKQYRTV